MGVCACGPVLTGVVHNALVHIDFAVLAGEVCRTLAVIAVDAVHAPTPVQAVVAGTVVNVVLTPVTLETCKVKKSSLLRISTFQFTRMAKRRKHSLPIKCNIFKKKIVLKVLSFPIKLLNC